ncbi:MAG TPA: pyridoxamine 5'-phosphate oxidase [Chitinophagaceae bacterium]|jgi:pyridoxamine 5'-phosphate oxidase|nr:pyridoxamine 5'-phosphate oxidase [Chitinophagaceae bacterium]
MTGDIAAIRKTYSQKSLSEEDAAANPVLQFSTWWKEAVSAAIDEVNAMTLATASADGLPSARIVLLKGFNETGFSFYTNYNSFKAQQLAENPKACLVFFWKELERQVRITGLIEKLDAAASDAYFNSRPAESRIGAIVSPQSQVIESREWLDQEFKKTATQEGGNKLVRPKHWGGYIVKPVMIEFWQGRPGRLHDRLQYTLLENGSWKIERLAP